MRAGVSRAQVQKKKSFSIYFSLMASFSIVLGGVLYFAYGLLPHQYYLPTSFAVLALGGIVVYVILARIVEL